MPAIVPFWRGESTGRSYDLGLAQGIFLRELERRLDQPDCLDWLQRDYFLDAAAARNLRFFVQRQRDRTQCVPTDQLLFDNPHAPNIAVTQLSGGVTAEATTGGGSSFFGGVGTPVLLNLADGSAYLASGSAPLGAKTAGGPPASAAPSAGGNVPSNAALFGVNLAESNNGSRTLTATVTDSSGNKLGTGSIDVPDGGWWVLGLTPSVPLPDPGPLDPPPIDNPPPVDTVPGTTPPVTTGE